MKLYSYMLAAVMFFGGMGVAADLYANTVNLNPTEDTWVSKLAPGTSHGSDTGITSSIKGDLAQAYALLKFDVSSILSGQTIQSAALHLYQFGGGGTGEESTLLYYYSNNNWGENTLTWNNMSAAPESILTSSNDGRSHTGYSTWSFSWGPSWGNIITLLLAEASTVDQSHNLYSKEYSGTALRPYLEITTTAVPIPAAIWLFGSGLLGLIGIRRFRK